MNQEETKNLFKLGSIALILLAVFLGVKSLEEIKNLNKIDPAYNSITVAGEGESVSIPDIATFSFAVSADAKTVAEAQKEVTNKMNNVLAALKDQGIAEKDIKTTDYSVYPKYSYAQTICSANIPCPPSRQVLEGYTASHNVTVKVRATDKIGEALSAAGDKGATNISSVTFTMDDPDASLSEARAKAIADAQAKAKILAKELGVRIVRVVSYSDNNQPTPYPVAYDVMGKGMGAASSVTPSLPTGENKKKVNVTVTYEIR